MADFFRLWEPFSQSKSFTRVAVCDRLTAYNLARDFSRRGICVTVPPKFNLNKLLSYLRNASLYYPRSRWLFSI